MGYKLIETDMLMERTNVEILLGIVRDRASKHEVASYNRRGLTDFADFGPKRHGEMMYRTDRWNRVLCFLAMFKSISKIQVSLILIRFSRHFAVQKMGLSSIGVGILSSLMRPLQVWPIDQPDTGQVCIENPP